MPSLLDSPQAVALLHEIVRGRVPGVSFVTKFGSNLDVDEGTAEDIWSKGGMWVAPTDARVHNIVSADIADTLAGTGARTVQLEGLGSDWKFQIGTVTLDGTTPVATSESWRRIHRMEVLTAGTDETNQGIIKATAVAPDSTITATIPAEAGETQMAIFTTPAGTVSLLLPPQFTIIRPGPPFNAVGGAGAIRIRKGADGAETVWLEKFKQGFSTDGNSAPPPQHSLPDLLPEKTDIVARCLQVSENNSEVTASFGVISFVI